MALAAAFAAAAIFAAPASAALAPAITDSATFVAKGSVGEAYVTGASDGDNLILVNASGSIVPESDGNLPTDARGSKIFREVTPGSGYTVRLVKDGKVYGTGPFKVLAKGENPAQSFYNAIKLKAGLNYVTVRDGIKLAMTVRPPLGVSNAQFDAAVTAGTAKYPTFIEYSGYQTGSSGQPARLLPQPFGRRAGRPPSGDVHRRRRGDRADARIRSGQRADARLGMFGRRIRPLRPADHL